MASMNRVYGTVELTEKERKARVILNKLHKLDGKAKHDKIPQPLNKTAISEKARGLFKELIAYGVIREVCEGKVKFLELVKQ